jgi:carbamoyl-phosphate synthase large subunit
MKLLFTGAGGSPTEALWRLLEGRYQLHFADADPLSICDPIPAERRHGLPFAETPGFVSAVADLARKFAIDLVVPGVDEELPALAALADKENPPFSVLVPQADFIATMRDKLKCAETLIAAGLPAPRTVTAANVASIGYPCFVKPRTGRGSRGAQKVGSPEQLSAYLTLYDQSPDRVIAQELLVGTEYTVMMAADRHSRLHAVVPVRVDLKRGITIRAATDNHPGILGACRSIHHALKPRGCYNIQLMATDDGRILPFEINPRVSTTMCLGVAAGVDPMSIFFNDNAPRELLPFRNGLSLRRYWFNAIT